MKGQMFLLGNDIEVIFPEKFYLKECTEVYNHFESNSDIVIESLGFILLKREMNDNEKEAIRDIMRVMDGNLQFEVYAVIEMFLKMINSRESQK